ncbi:unnamed protein product [Mytilus coruscus]|uniref:MADS-box domain-containing protein n=1 Tax=Mytilus coruscus TaxID=42192 RepID=A0A6J8DTR7_MYTCO|nr:unnamed protein product [Mytilus coruscus]
MESKPYNKTVVPRNPGKQKKGQEPSFQVHHTGPRGKEFINEDSARAKSLYKRRKTLFAKAEELHVTTGSDIFVEIKTQNQQPMYFKTDFYKDHKLKRDDEEDIDINNNSSLNLNESAETLDNSACSSSNSSAKQRYNSPTKRRPPVKKLKTSVNKAVQTRSMGVGESESEKAPNRCRVCGIEHESEDDIATDSRWIGCDFVSTSGEESECGYWVHEKCMGLYVVSGEIVRQRRGRERVEEVGMWM